ncbi:MAG TPA: acyltransferase [Steroidobacteraceae bacterium]|nr:acyltransferase [Steroidobacteraceae bacterium]
MGLLRLILALSVLNIHAKILGRNPIDGDTAVQLFFIISGFYMAMVLNEKYLPAKTTPLDFWKSRALRIFPSYCTVLLATLIAGGVFALAGTGSIQPFDAWDQMLKAGTSRVQLALLGIAQTTLLGLDVSNFAAIGAHGEVAFTANAWLENFPVWRSLFVPQAWTLSLELYFYLLAPFLVRRGYAVLLWIFIASFSLRVLAAVLLGYRTDPWSYRFFPFELLFFLAGVIAYRLGKLPGQPGVRGTMSIRCLAAILVFGAGVIGRLGVPGQSSVFAPALLAILFLGMSKLFEFTKHNGVDRLLGELSYPLYVSHVLVIWIAGGIFPRNAGWSRVVVPLLAICIAGLIYFYIDRRVDRMRHRRFGPLPRGA